MKWCALFLVVTGLCLGENAPRKAPSDAPKTFTGVIHDNRCVGPNCATQCPVTKGPTYTLQSGEDAWVLTGKALSDQKTPAQYVGKRVIVTGTVSGNKLNITSIAPAK